MKTALILLNNLTSFVNDGRLDEIIRRFLGVCFVIMSICCLIGWGAIAVALVLKLCGRIP